jgi:uncharacterized protein (TIGR00730 family)
MPQDVNLCIFCGSRAGARPGYAEAARRVGLAAARAGVGLVYGGGHVGLMGVLAGAALGAGGRVIGVIPEPLVRRELAHDGCTELVVVPGMHERKALMAARCSAFLMLPGGLGTFEEFFEVLTWAVLGLHNKPIGVLNTSGYFDPMLRMLDHAVAEGFVREAHLARLLVSDDPEALVADLPAFRPPPPGPRWIEVGET